MSLCHLPDGNNMIQLDSHGREGEDPGDIAYLALWDEQDVLSSSCPLLLASNEKRL